MNARRRQVTLSWDESRILKSAAIRPTSSTKIKNSIGKDFNSTARGWKNWGWNRTQPIYRFTSFSVVTFLIRIGEFTFPKKECCISQQSYLELANFALVH